MKKPCVISTKIATRVVEKDKIGVADELAMFMQASGKDILLQLGPISKEDHDYYEALVVGEARNIVRI